MRLDEAQPPGSSCWPCRSSMTSRGRSLSSRRSDMIDAGAETGGRPIRVLELRSVRGTGGGPEKTIMLGAARASPDVAVTVCYLRDQRDRTFQLDSWAARLGLDYVEIDERHSFDRRAWSELRELVGRLQIDVVHSHEYKTDLLALWLRFRTGVIPLATSHGWTGQSTRELRVYYPVDKLILRGFPRVIAVSSEIRTELIRHGVKPDRIEVILNAIDPQAFVRDAARGPKAREALGLKPDWFIVGAVGRLERQKRFDLLITAFAQCAAKHAQIHLVIAGDGSLKSELQSLIDQLGLSARCHLAGHRTDVVELHHAFDLLVQSSEYEGTPNAVLEAMAMETPVIATDVGGTAELLRHDVDGLIVPKHQVAALIEAIESVLSDPAAARMRAV